MYGLADVLHGTMKYSEVIEHYEKTNEWVPYPVNKKNE